MQTDITTIRNRPRRLNMGRFALALLMGLIISPVTVYASSYDTGIFEFQQKLANNGNPQAQYQLATMYESGRGVAKDINLAKQWYEKSAAQNYSAAKHRLTYLEIKTGGFKETHKPWVNQLAGEAKRGDGEAMFILGDMYENGIGVKKSLKRAESYYKSSAAKGNVDAENRLFNIEQKVNSERAQQQSSEKEKAKQEAAQKQKAEQERKARAAREKAARDKARAEQGKKAQLQAEQERRKLEAERKRLAEERRKLEAQKQALQAQQAKENAARETEQKKAEDDKFEAELCTGKAARFRTQCN